MVFKYNNYDNSDDNKDLVYDLRQTYAKLLDEILMRIAEARVTKNYTMWFEALDDLHTEISQKLDKDEKKTYENELNDCVKILNENTSAYSKQSTKKEEVFKIKCALKNLELWLKEKMENHNMFGAKDIEDDGL